MTLRGGRGRFRSVSVIVGTAIVGTLVPQVPASAHVMSVIDSIDVGHQVASATEGSQSAESPICVEVRQVDGIVQHLRVAIATADSEGEELEGRASEGSTLCSSPVAAGPFSVELTALSGQPGSTLHIEVLHGDVISDTFAPAATMTVERTGHGAALLPDGRVLVIGGEDPHALRQWSAPSSSEIYDPTSDTWEPAGDLKTYRYKPEVVRLQDGRVAVFGGVQAPYGRDRLVEVFDPASGGWSELGSLEGGPFGATATLLSSGKVFVAGSGDVTLSQASTYEIFDPATGTSTTFLAQTPYRNMHTATPLKDGTILLAGGNGNHLEASIFDPASGSFSFTGPMNAHRYGHQASLLDDGRVLVSGGRDPYGNGMLFSAEIYDPSTGSWTATQDGIGGEHHSTTQLRDGRVLAITSSYSRTRALALDPSTGTVSRLGSEPTIPRPGHAATTLQDGRILLTGGGDRHYSTATSELFTPTQL